MKFSDIDKKAVSEIRALIADMVTNANSGHPGGAIGMAAMGYVLFKRFLRFNPQNPNWVARDRFVLSNGHCSPLLYSLFHLFGYEYSMDDLKSFRKLHSRTPGHPERVSFLTNKVFPGVEVTTGPLGMGISNAVGMAMAAKCMDLYDKEKVVVPNEQKIYVFCGDGCMMEGVSSEACSLAGHRKLNNLVIFYDDNNITIDGSVDITFSENVSQRFEAYGFQVLQVDSANDDLDALATAIAAAQTSDKPVLIRCKTTIGYLSAKAGTSAAHSGGFSPEILLDFKKALKVPNPEAMFSISDDVRKELQVVVEQKISNYTVWNEIFEKCSYKQEILDRFEFVRNLNFSKVNHLFEKVKEFSEKCEKKSTRQMSQLCLQFLFDEGLGKYMVSGSADLTGSCLTAIKGLPPSQYINYGVREFAMCGISNGMAAYGAFISFDSTFMTFFSYCLPALRVGAIQRLPAFHVFTHDCYTVGEDGATHEPIEQISQIRAMPGVYDWRPCCGSEVLGSYLGAMGRGSYQHVFCLTRNAVASIVGDAKRTSEVGAYLVYEHAGAKYTIISSGSELYDSLCVGKKLGMNVVSMPCFKLFSEQPADIRKEVLKVDRDHCIMIEPYVSYGNERFAARVIGLETYGLSAKYQDLQKFFGFDQAGIESKINKFVEDDNAAKPIANIYGWDCTY